MKSGLTLLTFFVHILYLTGQETPTPPEGMVYVPAGEFIMGSTYGDPDERPQQIASTKAYFIDKYEVSNTEFAKFDPTFKFPPEKKNNAAVVTWSKAHAYAKWAGKRLPTEKEWEKAARGIDGRVFPWGDTYDNTYIVWDQKETRGTSIAKPASPYGCYDMAGSVWEWTSDWYKPYPGNEVPMEQYGETYKVMRGGSNFNNHSFIRTSQRYYVLPEKIHVYPVGIRCVKDIDQYNAPIKNIIIKMSYKMKRLLRFWLLLIGIGSMLSCEKEQPKTLDLSQANIVISSQIKSPIQETAANILIEEIKKRTDLQLGLNNNWDSNTTIALALANEKELFGTKVPTPKGDNASEIKKESYRLFHVHEGDKNTLWIIGADERGILYGIGKLLRTVKMSKSQITLSPNIDYSEAPEYALRGHQFGYRNTANSWDAWTVEQFDQHFREQVLFGANSFENIPFQKANSSPHFKLDPQIMEVELSKICQKYDADYWVWTPAPHDLTIKNAHADGLAEQEAFYAKCPRLDGVFVPGGDPGENHPAQLIPYLNDLSEILHKYHPNAGIWVSLQGFNKEKIDYFFNYLDKESPDWLKGVVYGPSSPPIDLEREMLPKKYLHRFYPDITHTVRCHYPVDNWDQAYALTLGREPINPQPLMYTQLFNRDTKYTDGFITYSDGSHDDVNKVLWSQLGWDSKKDPKTIIQEYTQFFFGPKVAEEAAQGIFNLEKNWDGPILENNSIKETLALWKGLEENNPDLANNWRWQQLIMRAYYDAYIQDRLAYEKRLEAEAYEILAQANTIGADKAMSDALQHIKKADTELVSQDLKEKVFEYGEKLFRSIGAQTSVEKYQARGAERGAILDFIDYPLNNRWWLEDEFNKIGEFKSEADKLARLEFIKNYESPGEGSFYDNISSADAKHVTSKTDDAIDFLWENDGISRKRLSTQLFQFTPTLEYHDLDPDSNYLIRVSGYGEALLRANGERLKPTKYEKGFEEFKEFPLPKNLIKDGLLKISFDKPDEEHLNWRKQSRVTDVWLIKQKQHVGPKKALPTKRNCYGTQHPFYQGGYH